MIGKENRSLPLCLLAGFSAGGRIGFAEDDCGARLASV